MPPRFFQLSLRIILICVVTASSVAGPAFAVAPLDYQTESRIYDALEKAQGLMSADRYSEAKPLLESVAKFDPSRYSGSLHENLASVYRELGYPEKGIVQAKLAIKFGASPGISYTMGLCYVDTSQFEEAQRWFQRFIIDNPSDPQYQQQARELIKDLEEDKKKVRSGTPKKGDYLDDVIANEGARKWKPGLLPFKLYIDSGKGVKNYRPTYRRVILEAFDAWCSASGNKLSYKVEPDRAKADVVVEWVGHALSSTENSRKRGAAGLTTSSIDADRIISSALIQIETYDFDRNKVVADSQIKSVCLHEIGHAIGVGHSPYVKDIMYFKVTPRQLSGLSARDRATATRLYADYPALTLVTGTASLPPECFALPTLPPGTSKYPSIPPSFFAKPPLPPQNLQENSEDDLADNSTLFAQPSLPKSSKAKSGSSSKKLALPSNLFAQPAPPPATKKPAAHTTAKPSSPAQLFAKPSLPPGR